MITITRLRPALRRLVGAVSCVGVVASLASVVAVPHAHADESPLPVEQPVDQPAAEAPTPTAQAATDATTAAYTAPVAGFTWSAPDRARQWAGNWRAFGQTKSWAAETYNPAYVAPATWPLDFNGCPTQAEYDLSKAGSPTVNTYTWSSNISSVPMTGRRCLVRIPFPAQGNYRIALELTKPDATSQKWIQPVRVQDKLIVVLGDSFASGEGAPDAPITAMVNRKYGYDYDNAKWVDRRCHRSARAGAIQAAYQLEDLDPHTSVTVLSFACSGATISKKRERGAGILGSYRGIAPPSGSVALAPQVDQLKTAVAGTKKRTIDALVVMAGINDIRFSDMIQTCLLNDDCKGEEVADGVTLQTRTQNDINGLALGYSKIRDALAARGVKYTGAFNVEYPSAFNNSAGTRCKEVAGDILPFFSIESPDVYWLDTWVRPRFTTAIKNSAFVGGFTQITGVAAAYSKGGYCAAGSTRLINTAADASNYQGPYSVALEGSGVRTRSDGTFHPNINGHLAVAAKIVGVLKPRFDVKAPIGKPDAYTTPEDTNLPMLGGGFGGLIDNDVDPNVPKLPLGAYGARVSSGTIRVGVGGNFVYTPAPNFNGTVQLYYVVSNGIKAVTVNSTITVTPVADPIVAIDDHLAMFGPQTTWLPVGYNDLNPDKRPVTITTAGLDPSLGITLAPMIDGKNISATVPYTATPYTFTFTYTLSDGVTTTAPATVTVDVTPNV